MKKEVTEKELAEVIISYFGLTVPKRPVDDLRNFPKPFMDEETWNKKKQETINGLRNRVEEEKSEVKRYKDLIARRKLICARIREAGLAETDFGRKVIPELNRRSDLKSAQESLKYVQERLEWNEARSYVEEKELHDKHEALKPYPIEERASTPFDEERKRVCTVLGVDPKLLQFSWPA